MKRALQLLRECADPPMVGFIGSRTRTCQDDRVMLLVILEMLWEVRAFYPVHGGKPPFDMYLAETCDAVGLPHVFVGGGEPTSYISRIDPYEIAPELLECVHMLIVFPREGQPAEATDPLVELAPELGIPVVSIRRNGKTEYLSHG